MQHQLFIFFILRNKIFSISFHKQFFSIALLKVITKQLASLKLIILNLTEHINIAILLKMFNKLFYPFYMKTTGNLINGNRFSKCYVISIEARIDK